MRIACLIVLMACGASTTTTTVSSTPDEAPEPQADPIAEVEEAEPVEPPAEGTALAAGRLGSVLDGLQVGTWDELVGEHGASVSSSGPDVPSDHVLTRTTAEGTYTLHVVAWESFRSVPADTELGQAATAFAGEGTVVTANEDLAVAAAPLRALGERVSTTGPEGWIGSNGALMLAQLSVAVRDATFVYVTLACEDSPACRGEDRETLIREVAESLRRGPALRSGGSWEIRVPRVAGSDRRIVIELPEGIVGLPPQIGYAGGHIARAIDLADGRSVMSVSIGVRGSTRAVDFEPGRGSVPESVSTSTRFDCEPFKCLMSLPRDEALRARLAAAFAAAEVTNIGSLESDVPLADGRLTLRLDWPSVSSSDRDYDGVESFVRYQGKLVRMRVRDTLRPGAEALAADGVLHSSIAPDRSNVTELESGDPSLTITRILPLTADRTTPVQLLVSERDGTGLIVELLCRYNDEACANDAPALSAELAPRFRRGSPVETTDTLRVSLGGRRMEIDLPEGYVTNEWYGEHHGGWGLRAHSTRGAIAVLEFEDGGAAQGASIENTGRRTGRRTTLRLGRERLVMRERRSYGGERVWGADLGCSGACVILIRTDDLAERDRLIAALASARVSRIVRTPCMQAVVEDENDDTLNLREGPSTHAAVVRALDNGTEVTIAERRGRWSRLSAPQAGWVWDAGLLRTCD